MFAVAFLAWGDGDGLASFPKLWLVSSIGCDHESYVQGSWVVLRVLELEFSVFSLAFVFCSFQGCTSGVASYHEMHSDHILTKRVPNQGSVKALFATLTAIIRSHLLFFYQFITKTCIAFKQQPEFLSLEVFSSLEAGA